MTRLVGTGTRRLRSTVAAAFGVFAVICAVVEGLSGADQSFSVISGILSVWAFVWGGRGPEGRPLIELLPTIQGEVRRFWKQEAARRGIDDIYYIPPHVRILPGLAPNDAARRFLTARPASKRWTLGDLQEACAETVYRFDVDRCVIYGEQGMGKTTIAIALTLGLLGPEGQQARLTPLTLSLAGSDPNESFRSWINRQLKATYPSLRAVNTTGSDDLVMALCASGQVVFILDGLDELPDAQMGARLVEINECFPRGQRVCVFSRPFDNDHILADAVEIGLCEPSLKILRVHLRMLARGRSRRRLSAIRRAVSATGDDRMISLLRTPMYLRLACRAVSSGTLDAELLVKTTQHDGIEAGRRLLIDAIVTNALTRHRILRYRHARRWLGYLAHKM